MKYVNQCYDRSIEVKISTLNMKDRPTHQPNSQPTTDRQTGSKGSFALNSRNTSININPRRNCWRENSDRSNLTLTSRKELSGQFHVGFAAQVRLSILTSLFIVEFPFYAPCLLSLLASHLSFSRLI